MMGAAGILAIVAAVSPETAQQLVPGWQQRFGPAVMVFVGLGFARAVFRSIYSVSALGFWVVAALCIFTGKINLPSVLSPRTASVQQQVPTAPAYSLPSFSLPSNVTSSLPNTFTGRSSLGSALPDAAYFPPAKSTGSESFSTDSLKRTFKSFF
jgi:hypothetical protein